MTLFRPGTSPPPVSMPIRFFAMKFPRRVGTFILAEAGGEVARSWWLVARRLWLVFGNRSSTSYELPTTGYERSATRLRSRSCAQPAGVELRWWTLKLRCRTRWRAAGVEQMRVQVKHAERGLHIR